ERSAIRECGNAGEAIRYPVGVGRAGMVMRGAAWNDARQRAVVAPDRLRGKIILSGAVAAAIAAFAFAPGSALAHDIVSVKDSYGPGTIVIRTGERRLYYFVGATS